MISLGLPTDQVSTKAGLAGHDTYTAEADLASVTNSMASSYPAVYRYPYVAIYGHFLTKSCQKGSATYFLCLTQQASFVVRERN